MLKNNVVVITGGAGLLGQQFCKAAAIQGALVVVADNNLDSASAVADEINMNGGQAEAQFLDITNNIYVDDLITKLDSKHGHIDAVVNTAYPRNKNWGNKIEDITYDDFCENTSMHLGGYFQVAQKFALYFQKRGGGNIVNLASIYGTLAPRFEIYEGTSMTMPVEYAAIKAAIIQMTIYFAQYFKMDGIRCNAISPGGIFDHQPKIFIEKYNSNCSKKGMLDPSDICPVLIFLLSEQSQYVTGQNLIVDDGFSI